MTVRVIIAGGSLGGLNAALWLREAGCDVDVFERSRGALEGIGAGIVLNPALTRWFDEHEPATPVGTAAHRVRYLGAGGRPAAELPHGYLLSSYDTLYRRMLSAFGRDQYHLGRAVRAATTSEDGVTVQLASGETREADLLVWADGIRSAGRAGLLPDVGRQYAGYVAWRGTVAPERLSPATTAALHDAITYCLLDHAHALAYPIPVAEGTTFNWLWYRNAEDPAALFTDREGGRREVSVPPGAVRESEIEGVKRAAAEDLPGPLAELVDRTDEPFLQAVFDIEVPQMAFGRQCLIGDAAFGARPHVAAGSAKAAEDGYRLACAVVNGDGDLSAALSAWEPGQLALGRNIVGRAREAGDRMQVSGSWNVGEPLPFGLHAIGDSIVGDRPA